MGTSAKIGYGSKLKRGDAASPEVFTSIAEIRGIGNFGSKRGLIDVTNLDSLNTAMEYLLAMKDGVEIPVLANFLPADATQSKTTGLIADHDTGILRNFQLALPSPFGTFSFSAKVLGWDAKVEPNGAIEATFTLKISGDIAYA